MRGTQLDVIEVYNLYKQLTSSASFFLINWVFYLEVLKLSFNQEH